MNRDLEKEKQMSLPSGRDIDPSALTTQLVWREIQSLKELQTNEILAVKEGIKVAHEDLVRVPTQLSVAIMGLQNLLDTKIAYESKIVDIKIGYESKINDILNHVVNKNFDRVEALRLEYKADSNKATLDALTAQKELNKQSNEGIILMTNKNEALFTKLIDAMKEKVDDVKNNQSKDTGSKEGVKDFRDWIPWVITILMFLYFIYSKGQK